MQTILCRSVEILKKYSENVVKNEKEGHVTLRQNIKKDMILLLKFHQLGFPGKRVSEFSCGNVYGSRALRWEFIMARDKEYKEGSGDAQAYIVNHTKQN